MTKSKSLRIQMVAAVTAMLLVSFMVVRTSSAAFTDSVASGQSSASAATVLFDGGPDVSEVIDVSNLLPGDLATVCYDITYGGSVGSVDLDVSWVTDGSDGTPAALGEAVNSDGLKDYLEMDVLMAKAGDTCTDVVTGDTLNGALDTDYFSLSDGSFADASADLDGLVSGAWSPDPDTPTDMTRAFVIQMTLPDTEAVTNAAQGDSATATFTWSVSSNNS